MIITGKQTKRPVFRKINYNFTFLFRFTFTPKNINNFNIFLCNNIFFTYSILYNFLEKEILRTYN